MVKALHRAGLEVILDVVFNHTAEGGHDGPTLSFRGLDNHAYYILEDGGARYADYSGCGNTLNANYPIVRRMIVDSLRYWVEEMHVDGFRFDLASILARDPSGQVLANPPVLLDIESDPALAGIKFMAEAWDASGLYQVGSFVGDAWKEWNGRFRDDVRAFFHGEDGMVGRFADRLVGSPELYAHKQREPEQSVNFVTCHDGFTLNDLVSYDRKHNEANRENNRDGGDDNKSWNCGVEGPTDDRAVERLRNRQVKNFLATTLLSIGLPMILMGDEVRRTQDGNNNLYCHDDERAWFDWTLLDRHRDVHRFVSLLNARRVLRSVRHEEQRLSLAQLIAQANKAWHGVTLDHADWSRGSHSLAFGAELKDEPRLAQEQIEQQEPTPSAVEQVATPIELKDAPAFREKYDDTHLEALAMGGALSFQSGWLLDTLSVSAVLYTSQPLHAPDARDGTALLETGQKAYTVSYAFSVLCAGHDAATLDAW